MLNIFRSPKKQEVTQDESSLLVKQFNGLNIQVYGTYEEPLFKAKDIGDLLEIKNIRDTMSSLDDQCKTKLNVGNADVGNKSDTWFLTEDGLYEILFISRKPIAKQFKVWIRNIIKEIRLKGKYDLQEQLKLQEQKEIEYKQLLQQKDQELIKYKEKTYEEIEKNGHVYVIKTDGGTKVGKTKDTVNKRIKGLQTGNVHDIEVFLDFPTSNPDLLEKCAHYILDRYRCNSNREFFDCDLNYIKTVVEICGNVLDTLKSTYQHISKEELVEKLRNCDVEVDVDGINECEYHSDDEYRGNNFYNWLEENVIYKQDSILQAKHIFDLIGTSLNTKFSNKKKPQLKAEVQKWIKEKHPTINHKYQDNNSFNNTKYRGWLHLAITDDTDSVDL
jgi:prophage antirepressor-like protein